MILGGGAPVTPQIFLGRVTVTPPRFFWGVTGDPPQIKVTPPQISDFGVTNALILHQYYAVFETSNLISTYKFQIS